MPSVDKTFPSKSQPAQSPHNHCDSLVRTRAAPIFQQCNGSHPMLKITCDMPVAQQRYCLCGRIDIWAQRESQETCRNCPLCVPVVHRYLPCPSGLGQRPIASILPSIALKQFRQQTFNYLLQSLRVRRPVRSNPVCPHAETSNEFRSGRSSAQTNPSSTARKARRARQSYLPWQIGIPVALEGD